MVWMLDRLQEKREDVSQIRTAGFLVDRTLVQARIFVPCGIDGVDVGHREGREKDFRWWLHQPAVPAVPTGTIQKQAVYVHAYQRKIERWDVTY